MSDYRRVLIPVDLTQGRQFLAPAVRRIIDTSDAEIILLHIVESQPWLGRAGHTLRLMSELEILANRKFRGARLTRRIEWGRPADCILNLLRTDCPDVVLMTAGGEPLNGSPLGTVASEVIAEAPCPVLLEWPVAPPVNQARVQPVCCVLEWDGNEARVLLESVWAAERCAAPLIVLCPAARDWEVAGVRSRVEDLCDRYAPGAAVEVQAGPPPVVIRRALRFHGAGLLVAGGSRQPLLAAAGECPVLYTGRSREAVKQYAFAARRSA